MKRPRNPFRRLKPSQVIVFLLAMGMGGIFGHLLARAGDALRPPGSPLILYLAGLLLILLAVFYVQIILHEAGHLVFGLLTGYRFSSFRIASFVWIKTPQGIRLKRLSLAGTAGQCLMLPPEHWDDTTPQLLYHLGGSLMNAITALVCFLLSRVVSHPAVSDLLLLSALIGLFLALTNGIPLRLGMIDNDGRNALSLRNDPVSRRALLIQLEIAGQTAQGVRLKDMPEDWFRLPTQEGPGNGLTAAIQVFACNRLVDAHAFSQAEEAISALLTSGQPLPGLYRCLLRCDLVCCQLLLGSHPNPAAQLDEQQQRSFMKSMKAYPSVLRTQYFCALLAEKDEEAAAAIRQRFQKTARSYPYPGEITSEEELMAFADEKRKDTLV
ncbi:MAG: hypothetical protein SOR61_04695 [Evtepia sp.]|uniref:hypothetical protein n=1 Tax=Evtepia sp. TaxID=2773933 RepID=UPI002A764617|nr:hypothetical protein [Evtepia sp.]MDY3014480.1 hypothetical protein [Evtepia sp.]